MSVQLRLGILVAVSLMVATAFAADPALDIPDISLWNYNASLRTCAGYKDNVLLNRTNPKDSVFVTAGLDVMAYRLPTHGWFFNFLVTADAAQYIDAVGVDNEQLVLAVGQLVKDFGDGWKSGVGVQYVFQHQVVDLSTIENTNAPGQVLGNAITTRWNLRRELGRNRIEFEMSGGRQLFKEPLDSYWQFGPRLTIGHTYAPFCDVALSYQFQNIRLDTREQLSRRGLALSGTSLEFYAQSLEFVWQHSWDAKRRWRTTTKLGTERSEDNGSGFFDTTALRASQKIAYHGDTWEIDAHARVGRYDYDIQPVTATNLEKRMKTTMTLGVHGEKKLTKKLKVFVNYSFDHSMSNASFDQYGANTYTVGVDWQF